MRRVLILMMVAVAAVSCACSTAKNAVVKYRAEVVTEYPHDASSYTQGLFFHDGSLYESVGQTGESAMRRMDLKTGKNLQTKAFESGVFLEGSVIFEDKLYILTWQNGQCYICDPETFAIRERVPYPREGWGLTTDGKQLIASDGSAKLYFLDGGLNLLRQVEVKQDGKAKTLLNELEYIDGKVWANVYTYDEILIIDPETGNVEGVVDCTDLWPRRQRNHGADVLNGIAQNAADGKIYLTGKYWKKLFEVRLVEK